MRLQAGTAHVWWLTVDDLPDAALARWSAVLEPAERARARRFAFPRDRRQFTAAHALLRGMLGHFAGTPPAEWRFAPRAHGKPEIHPDHAQPRLAFNISHTRGAVACALVLDHAVGVDIEDRFRSGNHLKLADYYFARDELAILRAAPEAEQGSLFFTFWTLKEAYIKAIGKGLSLPLDQFAFSLAPLGIAFGSGIADDPAAWQFATTQPNERHTLSLAVRTAGARPVTIAWRRMSGDDVDGLI